MNHYNDTENYKVITTVRSIKMWVRKTYKNHFEKSHKHETQERRNTGT